jgi:hypothetical protein
MRSTDMGIGDSIRKVADDAMKDLGDNSLPPNDGPTPEPGKKADDVRVHSSISEGSNAMEGGDDAEPDRAADEAARDSLAGDLTRSIDPDQDLSDSGRSPDEPRPGR